MKKKPYYGVHGYQMSWKTAKLDNFISGQEILIYQIQEFFFTPWVVAIVEWVGHHTCMFPCCLPCVLHMVLWFLCFWLGHTTTTCATCGGDSVCFIDCSTGRVMKKYKQPGETFYCLAWSTVYLDYDTDKKRKANLIAAGGYQNDIKIIEPNQLVCFEEIQGHKGVLECLVFHPHHPTWLLSAADDNTIMVWEIGLPKAAEYQGKSQ